VGIRHLLGPRSRSSTADYTDFTDSLMSPATQLRPSLPLPPNQNPKNRRNRRLFFDSCVQVQVGLVSGSFWTLGPGVQPQITRISQIFSCHLPRNCDLPFLCPKTKIPKIGVIGGYLLIRLGRYKLDGYPVPFGPSVPGFNRRLHGFHRFSHVTCHAIATFPSSASKPKSLKST
jgi:hypothetical protein